MQVAAVRFGLAKHAPLYRRIPYGEIAEVARRRYQLQPWAIQVVLHDGETVRAALPSRPPDGLPMALRCPPMASDGLRWPSDGPPTTLR